MHPEDALLPISALQHLLFCERQCALIHVEQVWADNYLTIQGQHLHKKAHDGRHETRHGVRVARGLSLRSLRLGLVGKADVVEFEETRGNIGLGSRRLGNDGQPSPQPSSADWRGGGELDSRPCRNDESKNPTLARCGSIERELDSRRLGNDEWPSPASGRGSLRVTPIEYKRGRPKKDNSDRVQLCAQALCLEEMLDLTIDAGEIFYGQKRRRTPVVFEAPLRALTEQTAERLHALIAARRTPLARIEPKCGKCSLIELCLPAVTGLQRSATRVVDRFFVANLSGAGPVSDDVQEAGA